MNQQTPETIRTNSLRAWWLAARPKTLTGAAAPVIVALSAAWRDQPFIVCGVKKSGSVQPFERLRRYLNRTCFKQSI